MCVSEETPMPTKRPAAPDRELLGFGNAFDRDRDRGDLAPDLGLELLGDVLVRLEELLRLLATLPEARLTVGEPGTGLGHHVGCHANVEQAAFLGDALAVHDVELGHAERRRHLVLDDLDADATADRVLALLDGLDAAD